MDLETDNAYEILGVSASATSSEIKTAYRKQALQVHPDRQSTDQEKERCQHVFAKLAAAYEILSDDDERKAHDAVLKERQRRPTTSSKRTSSSTTPKATKSSTTSKKNTTAPTPPSKKKLSKSTTLAKQSAPSNKTWQERTDQNAAANWNFAVGPKADPPLLKNSTTASRFHDPYEVFQRVFREEFGEDYRPGASIKESKAARNKPSAKNSNSNQLSVYKKDKDNQLVAVDKKKAKNQKKAPKNPNVGWDEPDNRPIAMRMTSKQQMLPDGTVETITYTYITRPDGKEEVIVKSSVGDAPATKSSSSTALVPVSSNNKQVVVKKQPPKKKKVTKSSSSSNALVPISPSQKESAVVESKSPGFLGKLFGRKQ